MELASEINMEENDSMCPHEDPFNTKIVSTRPEGKLVLQQQSLEKEH